MKRMISVTAAAVVLFAGAGTEARAAKPGPATTGPTTFTGFSSVNSLSGCSRSTDPTTKCTHKGVGTTAGEIGGSAGWRTANLPGPGAVPFAEGNAFGYGYGSVYYKVPSGTKTLEITSTLTVQDKLTTSSEGEGSGRSVLFSEYSPSGCSVFDVCTKEVKKTVTKSGLIVDPSLPPTSMESGSKVTLTQTIAAPEGQTLPEGTSSLRLNFIHFAGSSQTPGNAGTSAGTLKLDSIAITRR